MLLKELRTCMSVMVVVAGGCEVIVTLFLYIRIYKYEHTCVHTYYKCKCAIAVQKPRHSIQLNDTEIVHIVGCDVL